MSDYQKARDYADRIRKGIKDSPQNAQITLLMAVPTAEDIADLLYEVKDETNAEKAEKTGRWIPVAEYEACGGDFEAWQAHGNPVAFYYCSECKEQAGLSEDGKDLTTRYCPQCGARMVNSK